MKLAMNKAITGSNWFSNMIARADDMNFGSTSKYANFTNLMALLIGSSDVNMVLTGLELLIDTGLVTSLAVGGALSFTGSYVDVEGAWGFNAGAEEVFSVVVPEIGVVAFSSADPTNPRIDVLEIRPKQILYDEKDRKFKDPITKLVTSTPTNVKIEYGYDFNIVVGTPAGSPVAPASNAGWIKIAEVSIAASQTTLTQTDIKGVAQSAEWGTETSSAIFAGFLKLTESANPIVADRLDPVNLPFVMGKGFTNSVVDSLDLSSDNWTKTDTDVNDSGMTVASEILWELVSNTTSLSHIDSFDIDAFSVKYMVSIIVKKGNMDQVGLDVYGNGVSEGTVDIVFSTQTITPSNGAVVHRVEWLESDMVRVHFLTDVLDGTYTYVLRLFVDTNSPYVVDDFTYFTQPQMTFDERLLPFIETTEEEGLVTHPYFMSDIFTIDTVIKPMYLYDVVFDQGVIALIPDDEATMGEGKLLLRYDTGTSKFIVEWMNSGTLRTLTSNQFDDGSSFDNINQSLRFIISLELSLGGINDSRFIVLSVDDDVILNEDTAWSGTPDIKSLNFKDLTISRGVLKGTNLGDKLNSGLVEHFMYGNGYYVAVEYNTGRVWTATDPLGTWTDQGLIGPVTIATASLFDGTTFFILWADSMYYATDPTGAWTFKDLAMTGTPRGMAYNGAGLWVIVSGSASGIAHTASDPTGTWTAHNAVGSPPGMVIYGNGIWIHGGTGLSWTTDPTGSWTASGLGSIPAPIYGAFNGEMFVFGGTGELVMTVDGRRWIRTVIPTESQIESVTYANGLWLVTAYVGHYESADGINWVYYSSDLSALKIVYTGADYFVGGNNLGEIVVIKHVASSMNALFKYLKIYNGLLIGIVSNALEIDEALLEQTKQLEFIGENYNPTKLYKSTDAYRALEQNMHSFSSGKGLLNRSIKGRHLQKLSVGVEHLDIGTVYRMIEVEIGIWDMSSTGPGSIILHPILPGLGSTDQYFLNIRGMRAIIQQDSGPTYGMKDFASASGVSIVVTRLGLSIASDVGGDFDSGSYNATTVNRGFIQIDYVLEI